MIILDLHSISSTVLSRFDNFATAVTRNYLAILRFDLYEN